MENPFEEELNVLYRGTPVVQLKTAEELEAFIEKEGTKAIFVDASCGCAAETARPVFIKMLSRSEVKPDFFASLFPLTAEEAFDCFKEYFLDRRDLSSPGFYFYRGYKLQYKILDSEIELCNEEKLRSYLESIYDKYMGKVVDESVTLKEPRSEFGLSRIEADRLYKEEGAVFIDCRSQEEREEYNPYEKSKYLNSELVGEMIETWDRAKPIVFYCAHGIRSMNAVSYFQQNGFTALKSLEKGVNSNQHQS